MRQMSSQAKGNKSRIIGVTGQMGLPPGSQTGGTEMGFPLGQAQSTERRIKGSGVPSSTPVTLASERQGLCCLAHSSCSVFF